MSSPQSDIKSPPDRDGKHPVVSLKEISKKYGNGTVAVQDFSLDVNEGSFVTIIGPSGCGKSTILRIISGLSEVTTGTVDWSAKDKMESTGLHNCEMGFVFQEPTLMPWATVFGNVHLPLKLNGVSKKAANPDVMEALTLVGLESFADHYPRELSGGMKMRVSIARALATKPKLLLMDEPFAALDEITRFKLNNDILSLWEEYGFTVIFVTHSVFESVYLSNRILVMSARPGRIVNEIEISETYPRDDSFRMSVSYNEYCKQVSGALHSAIGAGVQT